MKHYIAIDWDSGEIILGKAYPTKRELLHAIDKAFDSTTHRIGDYEVDPDLYAVNFEYLNDIQESHRRPPIPDTNDRIEKWPVDIYFIWLSCLRDELHFEEIEIPE